MEIVSNSSPVAQRIMPPMRKISQLSDDAFCQGLRSAAETMRVRKILLWLSILALLFICMNVFIYLFISFRFPISYFWLLSDYGFFFSLNS